MDYVFYMRYCMARSRLHEGVDVFKPNYPPKVQRLASGASSTGGTIIYN